MDKWQFLGAIAIMVGLFGGLPNVMDRIRTPAYGSVWFPVTLMVAAVGFGTVIVCGIHP